MNFEEAIKNYLDGYAKGSPEFAVKYSNEKKTIEGCCNYIVEEARKQQKDRCTVMTDDAVYQLARHYYEEDDETLGINNKGTTEAKTQVKVQFSESSEKPPVEAKKPPKPKKEEKKDYEQVNMFDFLGEA